MVENKDNSQKSFFPISSDGIGEPRQPISGYEDERYRQEVEELEREAQQAAIDALKAKRERRSASRSRFIQDFFEGFRGQ